MSELTGSSHRCRAQFKCAQAVVGQRSAGNGPNGLSYDYYYYYYMLCTPSITHTARSTWHLLLLEIAMSICTWYVSGACSLTVLCLYLDSGEPIPWLFWACSLAGYEDQSDVNAGPVKWEAGNRCLRYSRGKRQRQTFTINSQINKSLACAPVDRQSAKVIILLYNVRGSHVHQ